MPAALVPIGTLTISGSSTTVVTFSSIVGTYRDLVLMVEGSSASDVSLLVRLNGDTASNYDYVGYGTTGTNSPSGNGGSQGGIFFNNWANMGNNPGTFRIDLFDYAQTNKTKGTLFFAGRSEKPAIDIRGHRWRNTAAITSISCTILSGNYNAGTVFALYGVAA